MELANARLGLSLVPHPGRTLLWTGSWDGQGSEQHCPTKQAFEAFGKKFDMQLVRANTKLGQVAAN